MGISFYIIMSLLAVISAVNLISAKAQSKSKMRSFGIWFNSIAFTLIVVAIIIALLIK